jgi:hypothetical protein
VRIVPSRVEKAVRGIEVLHAGDVHHSAAKVPKAIAVTLLRSGSAAYG